MRRLDHLLLFAVILAVVGASFTPSAYAQERPQAAFQHRKLLQAGNCALALNGVSTTYGACATLQGEPSPYRLYYSYDAAASTLTGAFAYPNPTGWVAWGINPASPGQMLGGSALVVKANASAPSGASIDSYYLGGYSPADVQPPGKLTVSRMSAAKAGGDLIGAFTMKVPAGTDPTAFGFLYVFGPLSPSGGLAMHAIENGLSDTLDLTSATAATPAAAGATPAKAAPAPAPAPAREAGDDSSGSGSKSRSGDDSGGPPAAASTSNTSSPATPSTAAAAAATGTPAVAGNATGNCLLTVGGTQEAFDTCTTLTGTPGAYTFHWSLLPGNKLRGGIDAVNPNGYAGWGQGPGGRKMVPGNGIIVKQDASAASGASVADYKLGGYDTASVTQPSSWTVTDTKAAAVSGGRLLAVFTVQMDANVNKENFPIIYTMGPVANGVLQPHPPSNGNSAALDLSSATLSGVSSGNDRRNGDLPTVHGWLNAVGLGLLLPLAVAIARTLREHPTVWFNMHRSIAGLGYALGVAGIAIGYYMQPFTGGLEIAHVVLGSIALALGFLQILAILARPSPDHKFRKYWAAYHGNIGRLLIAVVVANFYIGVHMSNHIASNHRKNWYIVYSVLLGAILLLALAKELFNATVLRRDQREHQAVVGVQPNNKDQQNGHSNGFGNGQNGHSNGFTNGQGGQSNGFSNGSAV